MMTALELAYRRGAPGDSRACFDVFLASIRDLTARQGTPWEPAPEELWPKLRSMYDHLAAHAAEWWVAEDPASGELSGYARSVERGGLFELSEFFVHPARQSAGVGRGLLERAFPPGRGEVRAIIATTDVRALRRYHAAGTFVRFPICALEGPPRADAPLDPALDAVEAGPHHIPLLRRIEAEVLEFERGDEFAWLLDDRRGFLYRRDGREVGFAFVGERGIGPIAALEPDAQPGMLAHVERVAAGIGRREIGFEVPMVNEVAMIHLLEQGFRMDSFFTFFLSSRPFGRFDRFIGFAPPFVL
jgi:GNAT superfamily N-acetyltransferase